MNLPIDELNVLRTKWESILIDLQIGVKTKKQVRKTICDDLLELLLIAYTYGCEDVNEMLGTKIAPTYDEMRESVYRKVAGEDFEQRVDKYLDQFATEIEASSTSSSAPGETPTIPKVPTPPLEDIMRIADTDSHRVFNEAGFNTADVAEKTGERKGIIKEWETKDDDRVRATHDYINEVRLPLHDEFITFDGDRALQPGGFSKPENNIRCRCKLRFYTA